MIATRNEKLATRAEDTRADRDRFVKWAKASLAPLTTVHAESHRQDLDPLGKMVGDKTIVALSEAAHGAAEPLEFRNRVLQYLVEQQGFTAIALESGIVESRAVHDYVQGDGDLSTALAEGISWTFDRLPQNRTLVRWLKEYNADPRHVRKINFYGFDVSGSPGEPRANRGLNTALAAVLQYLASVDIAAATAFHDRLDAFLPSVRFEFDRPAAARGYDQLSHAERDAVTSTVADLVTLFERQEVRYRAASAAIDYEWGYRAAIGARQVDAWLREIPLDWQPSSGPITFPSEQTKFFPMATDIRDRAQADNIAWIIEQEGSLGKVLVYGHQYHLSKTPVKTSWAGPGEQAPMGTYLRRRFGERLLTIGNLIGTGEIDGEAGKRTLKEPLPESIDALARDAGAELFLLDLRAAPAKVADWLGQEHLIGHGQDALKLPVGRAFDVLFYIDAVTPASVA